LSDIERRSQVNLRSVSTFPGKCSDGRYGVCGHRYPLGKNQYAEPLVEIALAVCHKARLPPPGCQGCRGDRGMLSSSSNGQRPGEPGSRPRCFDRSGCAAKESQMPKIKTKSGAKKRFKVTGGGKVLYQQSRKRHGMIKRTKKQIRQLRGTNVLFKTDGDNIKKYFLPNG
jgi:large subunit ribosomal protein L35